MALFDFLKPKATAAAASGISPRRPVLSHWQAGKADNRAFRSSASSAGPNAANSGYLNTARNRARDAVRNVPYAARAVELQVTNIVGTGIVPRFADRRLQDLWLSWEDSADAAWIRDIYGLQESATRAWLESGECFIRLRARRPGDGLPLPLQVELLESDMLPNQDWIAANGNPVYQGIELDGIGRREAYHFYLKHPGDKHLSGQSLETVRVPAERVCHLYDPARPGQLRGFPPLATVLQRMQQMSDFDEATIERQKLASALTFAIRRPQPDQPGIDPITGLDIEGRGASEISPGSAYQLLPGEDIENLPLPSLGGEYEAFAKVQGRAIAAGIGVPYELLTGDFAGLSDRTARVIISEYRRRVEQHQWHRLIRQMMRPIQQAFTDTAILAGLIPPRANTQVRWVTPAWPYFHPVQDVQAIREEIRLGLRSQTDAIYSRGNDPETVRAERQADREAEAAAGLNSTGFDWQQEQRQADLASQQAQAKANSALAALREAETELAKTNEELASAEFRKTLAQTAAIQADEALVQTKQQSERDYAELRKALAEAESDLRLEAISAEISAKEQEAEAKLDAWQRAEEHADQLRRVELQKRTAERDAALADYQATQAALAELTHGAGD